MLRNDSTGNEANSIAFQAYVELKRIASDYKLEAELEVPQLVVVGETSCGKSMLVQNFLGFPCSFTDVDVATRCPVAYRLVHNASLAPGEVRVRKPSGVRHPSELANYLRRVMEEIKIQNPTGFSSEAFQVEIESAEYTDFEIIDVPGLVTGRPDPKVRSIVEGITEVYVRNSRYSIVLLKEAGQLRENAAGALCIHQLCTDEQGKATTLPPRLDYRTNMITIQTKFSAIMEIKNGTTVNETIGKLREEFGETYFVNMVFDGYSMSDNEYHTNVDYIKGLPQLEKERVDSWIIELNRAAGQLPNCPDKFESKNRPLIGINVVRRQIQQLWLKAFREAFPRLEAVIQVQLEEANTKYETALTSYQMQDPNKVRDNYLNYVKEFQITLRAYSSYRQEVFNDFPIKSFGKTYTETERDCKSSWPRYQSIEWCAHRSADELSESTDGKNLELDQHLIGVRHFVRLHRIFHYMVLTYKPHAVSTEEINSAAAVLFGRTSDYDNLDKAVREWVRQHILSTFDHGVSWLTQMYIYILCTFREDVKNCLLAAGKFDYLKQHTIFLNAIDLEFHKTIRTWIRKAVQTIRDVYNSYAAYAHYDITARLKIYAFSIPSHIQHKIFDTIVPDVYRNSNEPHGTNGAEHVTIADIFRWIPKLKLLDLIYESATFLTQERNPQTLTHHENGRNAISELYEATCTQILSIIFSQFYSNVVIPIQEFDPSIQYGGLELSQLLSTRLNRMELTEVARIANINTQSILREIADCENRIVDLKVAQKLVNIAKQTMDLLSTASPRSGRHHQHECQEVSTYRAKILEHLQRKNRIVKRKPHFDRFVSTTSDDISEVFLSSQEKESYDEERELMLENDVTIANDLMLALYRRHDKEDLWLGLSSK